MDHIRSHPTGALLAVVLAAIMTAAPALAAHAAKPVYTSQNRLVPAYFSPSDSKWQNMCQKLGAYSGSSSVIMKPASGAGGEPDGRYREAMRKCHNLNQRIVGYVDTDHTRVSLTRVQRDIDAYYNAYPDIDGIYLDNLTDNPDMPTRNPADDARLSVKAYYERIFAHVRSKNVAQAWAASTTRLPRTNYVIGNGGTGAAALWQLATPVVDNLVVFEGTMERYKGWSAPAWVWDYDATKFSHLVYAVAPGTDGYSFRTAHELSRQRNAGSTYITADVMPKPWNSLSTDWRRTMASPHPRMCCLR